MAVIFSRTETWQQLPQGSWRSSTAVLLKRGGEPVAYIHGRRSGPKLNVYQITLQPDEQHATTRKLGDDHYSLAAAKRAAKEHFDA
jgi:hypothetical protein